MDNNSNNPLGELVPEAVPVKSLEESFSELDSLVGLNSIKEEMHKIVALINNQHPLSDANTNTLLFPYHYIFTIDKGCGLTTVLNLMAQIFYNLKIITSSEVEEIYPGGMFGSLYLDDFDDSGIIALHEIESIMKTNEESLDKTYKNMSDSYGKKVYVIVLPRAKKEKANKLYNSLKLKMNCRYLDFPPYTIEEFANIGQKFLSSYGYSVLPSAKEKLTSIIRKLKKDKNFSNLHTIESIAQDIRIKKSFSSQQLDIQSKSSNIINSDDIDIHLPEKPLKSKDKPEGQSTSQSLDNMIGLDDIKNKIEDIASTLLVQKKLKEAGINTNPLCLHMQFSGNPGTGKTTVARLVGNIFKEMGLLEKGEFFEVSRDDLVGLYMGHTASKTKQIITDAIGSVLFIDEAYSLVMDERDMYGNEAISTLVKEMENNRDKMVVILAGYTDDLHRMISSNPGLRERIPHNIEFPNYTPDELTQIFISILGKEYTLAPGVKEKMFKLFETAVANSDKDFGNARFARNLVERLKMKQARRLMTNGILNTDELLTILNEDIDELLKDADIINQLSPKIEERKVGFC